MGRASDESRLESGSSQDVSNGHKAYPSNLDHVLLHHTPLGVGRSTLVQFGT